MIQHFDFTDFYTALHKCGLSRWREHFKKAIESSLIKPDGNLANWISALQALPDVGNSTLVYGRAAVTARGSENISPEHIAKLKEALLRLRPWRKGPFDLCGVEIDSEWRSDLKWARVAPHLASLARRKVLDVGCGNGYYLFRMSESGASTVIGIDPSLLFLTQFSAVQRFLKQPGVFLLPIGFEDLPADMETFDTVFSMGVFYHRRSPFDFLRSLRMLLRQGGELVLETLIIQGNSQQVLVPTDRYARMNNVWFIPSVEAMVHWLGKAGFINVRTVDTCKTTFAEQRATEWMPGDSLAQCLNPTDANMTIEGFPAPVRAVFIANRP